MANSAYIDYHFETTSLLSFARLGFEQGRITEVCAKQFFDLCKTALLQNGVVPFRIKNDIDETDDLYYQGYLDQLEKDAKNPLPEVFVYDGGR